MIRVGLFGCGSLAAIIGEQIRETLSDTHRVAAVYDTDREKTQALAGRLGCIAARSMEQFLACDMDYVVEAAAPAALKAQGCSILLAGHSLIVLSAGAFADPQFEASLTEASIQSGKKVYVASGAIGGFDAMETAALMGIKKAVVINEKPPGAYAGAPFLEGRTLPEDQEVVLFEGSARQAIEAFPKNVNVAVAAARLSGGIEGTDIVIKSVPQMTNNSHKIIIQGDFGQMEMTFVSAPSAKNPGSSAMAAYSVIALLKKHNSRIEW